MDISQQIKKFDAENKPFYMVDHGDGHEWRYVFEKAFEGEENLKQITFDCEAGGFFCYSHDFEILSEYGRRFREMCMNEQEFTELV